MCGTYRAKSILFAGACLNCRFVVLEGLRNRVGRFTTTRPGAGILFGLLFLVGIITIALGDVFTRWTDYNRSILAAIGTAIVLIAPLAFGERLLRSVVVEAKDAAQEATEAAHQAQKATDSLRQQLRSQFNQSREEFERDLDLASGGDFTSLVNLYKQAHENGWIYENGLRVRIRFPKSEWVLASVTHGNDDLDVVRLSFESEPFTPLEVEADWLSSESAASFYGRVMQSLKKASAAPPEALFETLPGRLAEDLAKVIQLHTGAEGDTNIGRVVLTIGNDWVVTNQGLTNIPRMVTVSHSSFVLGAERVAQIYSLDPTTDLSEALDIAKETIDGLRQEHLKAIGENKLPPKGS